MVLMKAAVTGASGHVGNVLCRNLIDRGVKVKSLVHRNYDDLQQIGTEIIHGDLLDPISLENLCEDADTVFHLAAKITLDENNKKEVFRINVDGTNNLVNACLKKGVRKLVHFSSIHTLAQFPFDEDLTETRESAIDSDMSYELSKIRGENIALEAVKSGLHVVALLPTAIIGPWDYKPSFLGKALIKMAQNTLPMLVPGGYNWVDVRDVVTGAIAAAEKGRSGEKYILSGHYLSLTDLSSTIGKITGRKTPSLIGSYFLAHIGLPFIAAWSWLKAEDPLYTRNSLEILKSSNTRVSCEKARRELGYSARPIEETLSDTLNWFRQNKLIS